MKFCFVLTTTICFATVVKTVNRQARAIQQVSVRENHLSSLRCQTRSITISHRKEEQTRPDPSHLRSHSLLLPLQPTKIYSFSSTVSLASYISQTLLRSLCYKNHYIALQLIQSFFLKNEYSFCVSFHKYIL